MSEQMSEEARVHQPKPDGSCSLTCTCPTPLTRAEIDALDDLGVF